MEPLNATDKNVFYDQETNRCHIIGTILLEKTDADTVRDVIASRMTSKFYRLRSKMVKILDSYYFKEFEPNELKQQVDNSIFVRPDIKTMEQMSELMSQEQNLFLPEDSLQWRAWIVPNLEGDESAIIIKGHHVLGDGLAWLLMFGAIEDNYKPENWIQTTKVIGWF